MFYALIIIAALGYPGLVAAETFEQCTDRCTVQEDNCKRACPADATTLACNSKCEKAAETCSKRCEAADRQSRLTNLTGDAVEEES